MISKYDQYCKNYDIESLKASTDTQQMVALVWNWLTYLRANAFERQNVVRGYSRQLINRFQLVGHKDMVVVFVLLSFQKKFT